MYNENNIKKIIDDANNMLNGYYIFDGIWDMEPCPNLVKNIKLKWNIQYDKDIEWSYELVRMDYLYKFIIASKNTNDTKYIYYGLKIIDKWWKDNSKYIIKYINKLFKNNKSSHRTLDTSIMISNIVDYIIYCKNNNYITNRKYHIYKKRIIKIIKYLLPQSISKAKSFSNWGIIENGNILYCLNKLNIKIKYDDINSVLLRYVKNQINYNGSQIESSPMYLVQILLVLLKNITCNNCIIKEELIPIIKQSLNYIISIRTLNNTIPNIGDSDLTNISDLMMISSTLLKDDKYLKYINKDIDIEYIFKYNLDTIKLVSKQDNEELINYLDQNIYRNNNTYLLCSNIPRKCDGHKHYDYMNIIYSEYGKDLLVDLGRYSYKDDKDRSFFKSPAAHNVISIKNNPYYKYINSWITEEQIECSNNKYEVNDNYFSIKMNTIFGNTDLIISRYVTYIYNIGLIITDIINDKNDNIYETYFNIGEEYEVKTDNKKTIIFDNNHTFNYYNDVNNKIKINTVKYSKKYNEFINTKQINIETPSKKITHCILKTKDVIKVKYNNDSIEYIINKDKINIHY